MGGFKDHAAKFGRSRLLGQERVLLGGPSRCSYPTAPSDL